MGVIVIMVLRSIVHRQAAFPGVRHPAHHLQSDERADSNKQMEKSPALTASAYRGLNLIAGTKCLLIVKGKIATMTSQPANEFEETPSRREGEFVCDKASVVEIYPAIQAFIIGRLGWQLGEDATSETLRGILKRLPSIRAGTKKDFRSFCFGVAHHKINDVLRSKYGNKAKPLETAELAGFIEVGGNSPSLSPGTKDDLQLILGLLNASKFPCDQILSDHFLIGWEVEVLASGLGVSKDAMRMKIQRCLDEARRIAKKL